MKLSEYQEKLQQNPEYVEAEKKLKIRFALANAVLRARLEKGWSQGELADRVGTKQANISRIEAGQGNPTIDFILRLCEALEIDLQFNSQAESASVSPVKDRVEIKPRLRGKTSSGIFRPERI